MITLTAGQVWSIPFFPNQEDKTRGTPRWIFIVEDLGDSVEVIPLTKQLNQTHNYHKTKLIGKNEPEGIKMGLEWDSILIFDRSKELSKKTFIRPPCIYKGRCSEDFLDSLFNEFR